MQVIKDMEEHILRFLFAGKELNIINDKHIYHLIKMNEVVLSIVLHCVNKLVCEFFRRDIQYCLPLILIFYLNADSMSKVCFAHAHSAVNKKRVKRSAARLS